jgi:hypothetical protein
MLLLGACREQPKPAGKPVMPPVTTVSETPGEWTDLYRLVGRAPIESGLLETSPAAVDLSSALGRDLSSFRAALMQAGPLTQVGPLLVTRSPEAWLVLDPEDHAFRAGLKGPRGWREWHTAGSDVPVPREFTRAASDPASAQTER